MQDYITVINVYYPRFYLAFIPWPPAFLSPSRFSSAAVVFSEKTTSSPRMDDRHEFVDAESASFLHGEIKTTPSRDEIRGGQSVRRRLTSIISRALPYALVALASFGLGMLVSPRDATQRNLIPSRAIFDKSMTLSFLKTC